MDSEGICNRCLIQVNAMTSIMARWSGHAESCLTPNSPYPLAKWAAEMLYGNNATIMVNDRSDMFRQFSTWHGDPVCVWHLWELVDTENKAVRR